MSINPPVGDGGGHQPPPPLPYRSGGYQAGWAPPPGPGWNPPPIPNGGHAGKPPPRKAWYAVGAVMLSAGLVLIAVGIILIVAVFGALPSAEDTFASGESTTLHLDANETRVVFLANHVGAHSIQCRATGGSTQDVALERFSQSLTLNEWEAYFTLSATRAGDYVIGCTGATSDRFGVGGDPSGGSFVAGALAVVIGGGLSTIAVITLLITAVKRARRKGLGHPR